MAKDFAKTAKKRNSASRFDKKKTKQTIPGWTWLLAGLIIGVLASFIIYLNLFPSETKPVITKKEVIPSAKSRYQAVPAEEDTDYTFHNVLEDKTVEVPVEKSEPLAKNKKERRYIMQCGSFRKKSAAESLRAKIALNGFEAYIRPTDEKSGQRWFRVSLGPYTSKRTAERERHQLERNNINNCQIW